MSYTVGDKPTITATFALNGTPTDPTAVTFTYRAPSGTEETLTFGTDPEITRASAGVYAVALLVTEAGVWAYRWNATGTVTDVSRGSLRAVTASLATPALATLDELDAALARGGTATDYGNEAKMRALDVATSAFETACGSVAFSRRTRALTLDGTGTRDLETGLPLLASVAAVTVDGTSVDTSTLTVYATGRVYNEDTVWTRGNRNVALTATYGYADTPPDVVRAVTLIASSILSDGPFDDRGYGVTDDAGFVRLLTAGVAHASFSIPDVEAAVHRYRLTFVA